MYSHTPVPPPHLDSASPFVPGVFQPIFACKADPSSLHTRQGGQNCCTTWNGEQPAPAEPFPASSHQLPPSTLSRSPVAGVTVPPCRTQELRLSFQLVTADTGVSLQGGVSILGSQLWSHFYCPSLDHPTGTLKSCVISWS